MRAAGLPLEARAAEAGAVRDVDCAPPIPVVSIGTRCEGPAAMDFRQIRAFTAAP